MSGVYFNPLKRVFLNLSGGTVTGDTVFTEGVFAESLSGGTIYSGSTDLGFLINSLIFSSVTSAPYLLISGGTGGPYLFTGNTTGETLFIQNNILPTSDNNSYLGTAINRFKSLNVVDITTNTINSLIISGGTLYSGSTNLYDIFLTANDGNDITRVQPGSNITTGGTSNLPIINVVASPLFDNITFSGAVVGNILSANTVSASTLYSGSTNLDTIIRNIVIGSEDITRVQPGSNITTGGTGNLPIINVVASPSFNSIAASGASSFQTLSATTLMSGSTNLYNIFSTTDNNDITRVQPGSNITTGGTGNLPIINVVASPSFNSITASGASSFQTLSATTLMSGSTNLYNIFSTTDNNDITRVQPGSNITTGGTGNNPTVNVVASPSFNSITASGASSFQTLSATTLTSGSTNLNVYFNVINSQLTTKANLSGATFTGTVVTPSLSATIISGGTIYSGATNLYNIFQTIDSDANDITRVQPGSNITTGGTANLPTINLVASPSINSLTASGASSFTTLSATSIVSGSTNLNTYFNAINSQLTTKANLSGATFTGAVVTPSLSATTISGGTLFSGSTNLYNIFAQLGGDVAYVQPGSNITTGGTANLPTINLVASPSINSLTASGASSFTTLSATSIVSGSTNLNTYFNAINSQLTTKANLSGATFTGAVVTPSLSATTISGGTLYSGSTNLYNIFSTTDNNDITRVQPGSNITTGGTGNNPTVNVVASPSFNSIAASGASSFTTLSATSIVSGSTDLNTYFNAINSQLTTKANLSGATFTGAVVTSSLSATTISGGTLYSGGTNLYSIFQTIDSDANDITRVQPGSNITTGGTGNNPTVNIVASPSFNSIAASGASSFTTLSATSIVSGSTDLNTYFNAINSQLTTKANLSGATFTGAVVTSSLSATTISGGTLYSGGTNLYNIFSTTDNNDITRVQPGSNITTGGTENNPTVNVVASPSFNSITASGASSFQTLSATTLMSGSTNLYNIFSTTDNNDITRVQPGSNITTGGTGNNPIVNIVASPSFNGLSFSGVASGSFFSALTISGGTIYSGSTNLYNIFSTTDTVTRVQPGSNITTGGTDNAPVINVVASPNFNTITASGASSFAGITATTITDSELMDSEIVYAGSGGILRTNSAFTFDDSIGKIYMENVQVGTPSMSGTVTIWGNVNVMGESISAFTSQLLIEDNNISLNYNPTANTTTTSLGAGFTIQDGSGIAGTDVFLEIMGSAATLDNRSLSTNVFDIRIRESGTTSSPNGVRVLAENDVLIGGFF